MLQPRSTAVTLTGQRHDDHLSVIVNGTAVDMRCAVAQLLIHLVLARADTDSGCVAASAVTVFRRRRALDDAGGKGTGLALVEVGLGHEYQLAIPKERLAAVITVTKCFFELEGLKVITPEQARRFRQLFRIVKLPVPRKAKGAAKKKSRGNRKEIKKKSKGN